MRVRSPLILAALLDVALAMLLPVSASGASASYIVMLKPGVSVDAHLKSLKITPNRVYRSSAQGFEAVLSDTQYARELASPDTTIVARNESKPAGLEPLAKKPPQPFFPQEPTFGVVRVGGLISPTAAIDEVDTRIDVDVAIIDTGVDASHPDLNIAGVLDCTGNNGGGDKQGHGTFVAGLVGAIDNSFGKVGVAPGARIWSIQVANNNGLITDSALLCAMDWVTAHASTIEVANLSLGGPDPQTTNCGIASRKQDGDPLHVAVCAAVAAGVTVVVSAGNDSVDASSRTPASYPEVITVSAMADSDGQPGGLGGNTLCDSSPDDTFAFFSNFGSPVDIAAPGVCVSSTYIDDWYARGSGTSFSSPLVAGAAALYLSTHPGASPAAVRSALLALAEPGPIVGDPDNYPEGVLNVGTL